MPQQPAPLPAPEDDGTAAHLRGQELPALELPASDGTSIDLRGLPRHTVVFVHPSIGGPAEADALEEWTAIPGARGCTPEACAFRDELAPLGAAGAERVLGLSGQESSRQREAVAELALPYPLVSDGALLLAEQLSLSTFEFHGERFKRLTLIVADGLVEAALYPVFPPEEAAGQALRWLDERPRDAAGA